MKRLFIIIVFSLPSICFGQIRNGLTPQQLKLLNSNHTLLIDHGIGLWPYQKINFEIKVNHNSKVYITDDDGEIIHIQDKGSGSFQIITADKPKYIIIYDDVDGKHIPMTKEKGDDYKTLITFGDDAEVNVATFSIPGKPDTVNKHFVRLLALGNVYLEPNFSVSLEKITPPGLRTEPRISWPECYEENIIVDTITYLKFKNYFSNQNNYPSIDTEKTYNYNFLEVNIDYKHRYYIPSREAVILLKNFIKCLQNENLGIFTKRLNFMISGLELNNEH